MPVALHFVQELIDKLLHVSLQFADGWGSESFVDEVSQPRVVGGIDIHQAFTEMTHKGLDLFPDGFGKVGLHRRGETVQAGEAPGVTKYSLDVVVAGQDPAAPGLAPVNRSALTKRLVERVRIAGKFR